MRRRLSCLLLAAALASCGPSTEPEPIVSDPLDPSTGGDEGDVVLPLLRRLGRISSGTYLFQASALGEDGSGLRPAELIEVSPDAFVVSVDGGPHREVPRRVAWPMACLRTALDFGEAGLRVHLDEGAPVYVLASTSGGARVSIAIHMEHSHVVHPTALTTDECPAASVGAGEGRIARLADGDAACLFPDREGFDETVGVPIPGGTAATLRETADEWASIRAQVRGGWAQGWAHGSVYESGAARTDASWDEAALAPGRCLFPGRSEQQARTDPLELREDPNQRPMIPPENIERVFRQGQVQVQTCYEARLNELPELAVDLEVLLLVDPDGRVDQAQITRGRTADSALSQCVLEVVRRWRFLPPRVGAVELRRSFNLRPPVD